jgi:hypothetical protein
VEGRAGPSGVRQHARGLGSQGSRGSGSQREGYMPARASITSATRTRKTETETSTGDCIYLNSARCAPTLRPSPPYLPSRHGKPTIELGGAPQRARRDARCLRAWVGGCVSYFTRRGTARKPRLTPNKRAPQRSCSHHDRKLVKGTSHASHAGPASNTPCQAATQGRGVVATESSPRAHWPGKSWGRSKNHRPQLRTRAPCADM